MKRIAIITALPGELKPLVAGWHHVKRDNVDVWRRQGNDVEWIAACAGMGQQAAMRAFAEAEQVGKLDAVISAGWVGALDAENVAGEAYVVSGVIDAQTGERYSAQHAEEDRWLVTSMSVAGATEKSRLAATYHAGLVDMEASAVARMAQMRDIAFCCVKGVSDGRDEKLPDFNRFISQTNQLQLTQFILFVLFRPLYWPALIRMGENSKKASGKIAELVQDLLENQFAIEN